jgi:hypothetical protein
LKDLLIPVDPAEMLTLTAKKPCMIHLDPTKMKKTKEVQDLSNASGKNASISPDRGGEEEEINGTGSEQKQGKVTPPRDETDPLKKRKVSPLKPSSRKKSRATVTKMKTMLTTDDFDFIIAALNDASLEIMEKKEAKKEEMYDRLKVKFQGVQQALQSSCAMSTVPLSSGEPELGDEPAQLHRLADAVKARLHHTQEEVEQATQTLKKVQGDIIEQQQNCRTREGFSLGQV